MLRVQTVRYLRGNAELWSKCTNLLCLPCLETRMVDHTKLVDKLGYNSKIQFPATGSSGGIVIMWDNPVLSINDIVIYPQAIHIYVKVIHFTSLCFLQLFMLAISLRRRKYFGKISLPFLIT